MNHAALNDLTSFLAKSPTAWHAASEIGVRLAQQGFSPLNEEDKWELSPGSGYFVQRGGSVCAFVIPKESPSRASILASHTDSPALKLKPHPLFIEDDHPFLRTEVYGGPILKSFQNRDLAIAGRVLIESNGEIEEKLLTLDSHPIMIPVPPIHLDREVNDKPKKVDRENDLCALVGHPGTYKNPEQLFEELLSEEITFQKLLGFDLYLVPNEPPRLSGKGHKLLSAYRLDNLVSVHASLLALLDAKLSPETIQMSTFFNHEEIGSATTEGASSPFFQDILKRITLHYDLNEEDFIRMKARSQFISIDNAHAYDPLHKKLFDQANAPRLGKGVVIKHNANHRYATTGSNSAEFIALCEKKNIPYQNSAGRADISCGSTLGKLAATQTGIDTIDIGISQLSMHAARELISIEDHTTLCRLLKSVLEA